MKLDDPDPSLPKGAAHRDARALLILAPVVFLVLFMVLPLVWMLVVSLRGQEESTLGVFWSLLATPLYRQVWLQTILLSAVVASLTLFLGYPLVIVLVHSNGVIERLILALVLSSMWIGVLVRSYAWIILLQSKGPVSSMLLSTGLIKEPLRLVFTRFAVVMAMTHILLPFMVLILWSSLRRYGSDLQLVASSLGAGRAVYLFRVFLPVSRSAIAAGTLLVFLLSIGFFITPALLGGGRGDTMMIAMLVEEQVNTLGRWRAGSALALLLMASVLVPMWLSWRWRAVREVWQDLLSGGTDV